MEERYIKIDSCRKCNFSGHIMRSGKFIYICNNPDHKDIAVQREEIESEFYPVTGEGIDLKQSLIPSWCMLPNTVMVYATNRVNYEQFCKTVRQKEENDLWKELFCRRCNTTTLHHKLEEHVNSARWVCWHCYSEKDNK